MKALKKLLTIILATICIVVLIGFFFLIGSTLMEIARGNTDFAAMRTRVILIIAVSVIMSAVGLAAKGLFLILALKDKGKRHYS